MVKLARRRAAGRRRGRRPGAGLRKLRMVRRVVVRNQPSFTETFAYRAKNMTVTTAGLGQYFDVSIQNVPQVAQYANLYTQYRINWVKVMLIPQWNTNSSDFNAATFNQNNTIDSVGMARIVYSIQNSPGQSAPTTEDEVLEDNGCRIKSVGSKWSCSFKPVPDMVQTNGAGGIIPVKNKSNQWFNFDTATPANNPKHGGVKAFISLPGTLSTAIVFNAYYKVSFSLRDPQ